jgi:hypothetical protein
VIAQPTKDKEMKTKSELLAEIKTAQGRARNRILAEYDVDNFLAVLDEHRDNPATNTIRVYPQSDPFVARSYKYAAFVFCLCASRRETGEWNVTVRKVDAHRAHGQASKITINNH